MKWVMTQRQQIEYYLLRGYSISSLEALELFGCINLSGRISELKKAGFPIEKSWIKLPNGKHVVSYSFGGKHD